ncbi:uncharacterized protein Z520_06975 [Fonsecaea multimorphosa CBS 102226]|uniref:Uncharacterized protein n=1 Tax=Fonsecaea multimorphosa CBS 102226 TaxID=1442371 RepID=A0A0D2KLI6_9EURO|nr:uncharacterized protein Z520_06975 [Fonsecaea multimorphosa CBS 102226]KIX97523.1 hypothetical protein Z520_06975 [Fonsecaea multimorphosa CBS 102226]OAL23484.1 hypothetical protein AYO22_06534 [Fonsecaea multimorphosa]
MPPKRTLAATQRPPTHQQSTGVKKSRKVDTPSRSFLIRAADSNGTPIRRTTRSSSTGIQAHLPPSIATPSVESLPPKSINPALTATGESTEPPLSPQGKRKRESQRERPDKRRREGPSSVAELAPSKDLLNWKNLEKLNSETALETSDDMTDKKRTLSRRSSTADMNQDASSVSSQKTSLSLSDYRLNSLDRARIIFRHRGIPEPLKHRVNAILQPELDKEKETLIYSIADDLCDDFPDVLEVASREDDCVELIYQALEAMNRKLFGKTFGFRRKADWDPALKPKVQRKSYRSEPPDKSLDNTVGSHDRPIKRQQAETSYVSPESSEITMPPPQPPPKIDNNFVKNARPDITIGFLHAVVAKKLVSMGVNQLDAEEMLKDLQYEEELLSSPTLPALHIRFPSMVVVRNWEEHGRLVELTERRSPATYQSKEPLAFSITHEGPILLLWLHSITSLENARFYNVHVLKICHATIPSTTREFFIALAGVMEWASTEFLDDIAAQLVLMWKAAQKQTT